MNILMRRPAIIGNSVLDDLFSEFFRDPFPVIKRSTEGYPVTDIFQDESGNQVIEMALAGFSKENIKVEVKDNSITIMCESKTKEGDVSNRKIATRAFSKTFVDYNNKLDLMAADVKFENGLLSVILPPLPENKPKLIEIKDGDAAPKAIGPPSK